MKQQNNTHYSTKKERIMKKRTRMERNFRRGISGLLCASLVTLSFGGQGIGWNQTEEIHAETGEGVVDATDPSLYENMDPDVATINIKTVGGREASKAMKKGDDYLDIATFDMKNADGTQRLFLETTPAPESEPEEGTQEGENQESEDQGEADAEQEAAGQSESDADTPATVEYQAKFKVRGNTTAKSNKRPYNIKFAKKQAIIQEKPGQQPQEKAKKYCLISNSYDPTLMRNYVGLTLAEEMGLAYTSNCEYVDLTIDGVFVGNYLLTEAVEVGSARVDIDPDVGEFLVMYEREREEEGVYYIDLENQPYVNKRNYRFEIKEPEVPTIGQEDAIRAVLSDIKATIATGNQEEIAKKIDLDSFVKVYLFTEFMKVVDANFSSVYYYYKDGKLYAGPVWDFDLSSGNAGGYYGRAPYSTNYGSYFDQYGDSTGGLWARWVWYNPSSGLMQWVWFNTMVYQQYAALRPHFENVYKEGGMIDTLTEQYARSYGMNFTVKDDNGENYGWNFEIEKEYVNGQWADKVGMAQPKPTYAENVDFLQNWFEKRTANLDELFFLDQYNFDYTAYDAAKAKAEALDPTDYTNYDAVATALKENDITTWEEITQEKIDAAADAINAAVDSLQKRVFTVISDFTFKNGVEGEKIEERDDNTYTTTTGAITSGASLACYAGPANNGKYRSLKWSKAEYQNGDEENCIVPILTPKDTNNWGDQGEVYFQIETSTSGYEEACFNAALGATKKGPKCFKLQYSLDGEKFTDIEESEKMLTDNKEMQRLYKNFPLPKEAQNQRKVWLRIVVASSDTVGGEISFFGQPSGEIAINQVSVAASKTLEIDREQYKKAVERADSVNKEAFWYVEQLEDALAIDVSGDDVSQFELDEATYAINQALKVVESNPRKSYSYYYFGENGNVEGTYATYYEGTKFKLPNVFYNDHTFLGWAIVVWNEAISNWEIEKMYDGVSVPDKENETTYYQAQWSMKPNETQPPAATPKPTPTATPTIIPEITPTPVPTATPTQRPTARPRKTATPTVEPTEVPATQPPVLNITEMPTQAPTQTPVVTQEPTAAPVETPVVTEPVVTEVPVEVTLAMKAKYKVPVKGKAAKVVNKTAPASVTIYTKGIKNMQFAVDVFVNGTETTVEDLVWSSSNKNVASVNQNGVVTARKAGTTVITATTQGKSISCKVIVKAASMRVGNAGSLAKLKAGSMRKILVSATPTGKYQFASSNSKIVYVSSTGVVRARKKGRAVISIKCNGLQKKITIRVK